MKLSLISAFILLNILISCNEDYYCHEQILQLQHLDSDYYGCSLSKRRLVIDLQNDLKIIRSKEAYDSEVSGSCHPDIDFNKYDLVIGKQSSANENDTIIYDYRSVCPFNEATLTINIIQSDATRPDNVVYHAIIPKLDIEAPLRIIINVK